ncbi:MAG: cell surface protein SprA, partial [candidate division Zixibacteria bacterium]|nr:cell surface protein SprA [candidate division Zixibacteria bacterium]
QKSKFPSLNMEQISRFDITGTIGSKISVTVSQDSQTDIPLANRIKIRYKGDEDDILKGIEAGNTTLSLPNTRFVGYSSNIRGLFGIKTEAQLGSMKLTAIASQEKGTSERTSFTPTGEESAEIIRDCEYAERRIFDLDIPGADSLAPGDSVINLRVYEQETRNDNNEALSARLYVDPDNTSLFVSEEMIGNDLKVNEIEQDRYRFYNDPERGRHYVWFKSAIRQSRAVGMWMVIKRADQSVDTIGNISGLPMVLKLLCHNNPISTYWTWKLMWRNCYNIPRGVSVEDLNVKVLKGRAGTEQTANVVDYQTSGGRTESYLEILGLDQYNTTGEKLPDGKLDERDEVFRSDWGLLIFPEREPFNSSHTFTNANGRSTMELDQKTPNIYSSTSADKIKSSEYFIRLATRSKSTIIRLNKANIIEGSERITSNGRLLKRDVDYRFDYFSGQVTLLSDEAIDPNSDINIEFEYAPFMIMQKKTLLGARAEYEWSKDLQFGGTILYKSDKAQDRKPRVGQETAKSYVYDLDASFKLYPQFLTTMANALPLVETESPSNLSISGEIAQSHPNPNVDGVAYIDDFESALEQLSLGSSRALWQSSSKPLQLDTNHVKGKLLWHTPRHLVRMEDVYRLEAGQGQGTMRTFRMIFRPKYMDTTWVVENEQVVDYQITNIPFSQSWAGITRYYHRRVDPKRAQLFEVRLKGNEGKLHFDFGEISEDIAPANDEENSEDYYPYGDGNGAVDESEDTGLDQNMDPNEPNYHEALNPDPNGDNWYFLDEGKCPLPAGQCAGIDWEDESIRYEWLNGTEGNMNDESVLGRPDREALSSNGWQTNNSYFAFDIDLATDSLLVEGSEYNGWRTYRIPIRDQALDSVVTSEGMDPIDWSRISHVRVWFESEQGQTEWDTVEVAAWYFVQSNWQDTVLYASTDPDSQSTKFVVASVSEEDGTFTAPPGVEAYKDPTSNITESQRGLLLSFSDLDNADTCLAIKELISVDHYSGYRNLEMYVHGSENIVPGKVRFIFRIGQDENNFYEHRSFIYPGWNEKNHVKFDFNDLTAFKDSLIRSAEKGQERFIDDSTTTYRVKGAPNLSQISYFAAGVVNASPNPEDTVSGDI